MAVPGTLRAFIAVELPSAVSGRLADVIARLDQAAPEGVVRWVRPEGIHLTLKFLGDTPASQLNALQSMISSAAQTVAPFECVVGGLGCFPNLRQPRVVWVGLREASGALERLQRALEAGAARLGYPKESGERGFSPHLTLGRIGRETRGPDARRVGEIVQAAAVGELGILRVDGVNLMKSELRPGGAVYIGLYRARLGAVGE